MPAACLRGQAESWQTTRWPDKSAVWIERLLLICAALFRLFRQAGMILTDITRTKQVSFIHTERLPLDCVGFVLRGQGLLSWQAALCLRSRVWRDCHWIVPGDCLRGQGLYIVLSWQAARCRPDKSGIERLPLNCAGGCLRGQGLSIVLSWQAARWRPDKSGMERLSLNCVVGCLRKAGIIIATYIYIPLYIEILLNCANRLSKGARQDLLLLQTAR